jgi:iron complex outermembrane receptor protein
LLLSISLAASGAEEPAAQAEEEPIFEVEVVGFREPEEPGVIPTSVSVITRTEIERSGAQNLMDLLVREAGVWVSRQGGLGYGGAVSIRGFGGSPPTQVAVSVDGHPSQMGIMGHILPSSYLLDNVERVEIMRGPAGTLQGHMAMGGAINIVTRAGRDEEASGSVTTTAGTFDTRGTGVWLAGAGGNSSYRIERGQLSTDGDHPFARYREDNCSLAVDARLRGDWEASLRAQQVVYRTFDQQEVADAYAEGRPAQFIEQHFDRQDYDLEFTKTEGERVTGIKLYRADGDHNFDDGFHAQDYGNGIMLWQRLPQGQGRMRWGIDWGEYGGDIFSPPPLRNRFSRDEWAGHFMVDFPAGRDGTMSAGLRYTKPEGFDGEWLPEIGFLHPMGQAWSLFGSTRRGYRVPSFRELFLFGINNPKLLPEQAWQYEMGVRRSLPHGAQVEASVFLVDAESLIVLGPRPADAPPGPPVQWANTGKVRRHGLEVGVRKPLSRRTAVYANCSYLDPGEVKLQTVGRKLTAGVDHRVGEWTVSGDLEYVDRLYDLDHTNTLVQVPSFLIVNLKATREVAPGLRLGIVAENLFDRTYSVDPAYPYPMPGRSVRLQAEQTW